MLAERRPGFLLLRTIQPRIGVVATMQLSARMFRAARTLRLVEYDHVMPVLGQHFLARMRECNDFLRLHHPGCVEHSGFGANHEVGDFAEGKRFPDRPLPRFAVNTRLFLPSYFKYLAVGWEKEPRVHSKS